MALPFLVGRIKMEVIESSCVREFNPHTLIGPEVKLNASSVRLPLQKLWVH